MSDPKFVSRSIFSAGVQSQNEWIPLGAKLKTAQYISRPSLTADPRANPILAFSSGEQTFVMRWKGNNWVNLGKPIASASGPSIGQDSRKRLYLCAGDGPFVWRWNGSRWKSIGGNISEETGYKRRRYLVEGCGGIVLDSSDNPIVSWPADVGAKAHAVYAARWEKRKKKWVGFGEGHIGRRVRETHIDIDQRDRPYVATHKPGGPYGGLPTSYFWRWKGKAWEKMGIDMPNTYFPVIAVYDNRPYGALSEKNTGIIRVIRWRQGDWEELPSPGNGPSPRIGSTPALDFTLNGKLVMAFLSTEDDTTTSIRVKYLKKGVWQDVGDALVTFTDSEKNAVELDIAVDKKGRPTVSWTDRDFAKDLTSVFAKRYGVIK
jgi:hypothetical protein